MCMHRARFSWDKWHWRQISINFIKLNYTNTLVTCWIRTSLRRVVFYLPITFLDFPICRFHLYTLAIFLLTNLLFVKTKCLQWTKINFWFLSTIICKGCTWFSMISTSMEKRYEKQNTMKFQKKFKLGFEMGIPVNETEKQHLTITINNTFFHISYVSFNISTY